MTPAALAPEGEIAEATAISGPGHCTGGSWLCASRRSNQSVLRVTVSPRSSGTTTSSASAIMRRCSLASIPSMKASVTSWPGPQPSITRPRV